jgi:hypothetical protein
MKVARIHSDVVSNLAAILLSSKMFNKVRMGCHEVTIGDFDEGHFFA